MKNPPRNHKFLLLEKHDGTFWLPGYQSGILGGHNDNQKPPAPIEITLTGRETDAQLRGIVGRITARALGVEGGA